MDPGVWRDTRCGADSPGHVAALGVIPRPTHPPPLPHPPRRPPAPRPAGEPVPRPLPDARPVPPAFSPRRVRALLTSEASTWGWLWALVNNLLKFSNCAKGAGGQLDYLVPQGWAPVGPFTPNFTLPGVYYLPQSDGALPMPFMSILKTVGADPRSGMMVIVFRGTNSGPEWQMGGWRGPGHLRAHACACVHGAGRPPIRLLRCAGLAPCKSCTPPDSTPSHKSIAPLPSPRPPSPPHAPCADFAYNRISRPRFPGVPFPGNFFEGETHGARR